MTTYTIDTENSITALGSEQADFDGEIFASQRELGDLAAKWPANRRLVEVYNGIPGLTPVKKFTDRKSAVARIWKAIQSLGGGNGPETPEPAKASATAAQKQAKKAKHAPKRVEKAKNAKNPKNAAKATTKTAKGKPGKAASKPATARDGSKKAEVLGLLPEPTRQRLEQQLQYYRSVDPSIYVGMLRAPEFNALV